MFNRSSCTPQVQDSDGQSDPEHFDKNLETICQVILAKTSQKMIVNLLMMVLIDLPIIKFTCQHHISGYVCLV